MKLRLQPISMSIRHVHLLWLAVTYLLACTLAPAQTIRYVSTTGTNTNPVSATSWATSTTNLQGAINASASNDEVWVRSGTYRPTTTTGPASRTISFSLRAGVKVYGGFAGTETDLSQRPYQLVTAPTATTLSGDIGTVGNIADNSFHVINTPPINNTNTLLDGFVITGGNANGPSPDNVGGGMLNDGRVNGWNGTIRNCLFVNNRAEQGGAIYNNGTSGGLCVPRIINCGFLNNWGVVSSGSSFGGAVFNVGSGGNASPIITNCSFQSNTATFGGAIRSTAPTGISSVTLTNCVLFGNGGANTISVNSATVTARYSLLENSATNYTSGPGNLLTSTLPFQSSTDLRLPTNSVGINSADPATTTAAVGTSDLGLQPRFVDNLDMGAYEFCVAATRLFVRAGAAGANTGLTWSDAFTDLQSALNYACLQTPAEIWVATGTYRPTIGTDRTISFAMRPGVALYGGFLGTEAALNQRPTLGLFTPSSTTLSGDIGTPNSNADNSYHVIFNPPGLTNTALLDGFVVTGGNANGTSFPNNSGGGIFNNGDGTGKVCNPTLRQCLFVGNRANYGGALFNNGVNGGSSSPTLINCAFQGNTAILGGGATYNFGDGGGSSSPLLTNCAFQGNQTTNSGYGGAIYNAASANSNVSSLLTNCSFQGNTAAQGEALYNDVRNASVISVTLVNCVLFGNGGANTIISNNVNSNVSARYSLFEPSVTGYTSGPGNLTVTDSPFASATTTRLRPGSPAIDAGDPATTTATVGTSDGAGLRRFVNPLDMGAFELQLELFPNIPGPWNVPSNWSDGRIPQPGDRVLLQHPVTLPAGYVGTASRLRFTVNGRLVYGIGSVLRLEP